MFRLIASALAIVLALSGQTYAQGRAPSFHMPPPIHSAPPLRIDPINPVGPTINVPLPPPPEAVIDNPGPPALSYCVDSYGRGYCSTDCCDQGGRARCN